MKNKTNSFSDIIRFPIAKIIIGGFFCVLIPVLINKLILDTLFNILGFNNNLNIAIRVFITTFILMPSFYNVLYSKLERRKVSELYFKNSIRPILYSFILSSMIIGMSFLIFTFLGYIKILETQLPELIIVNLIVIMGFVITEEVFFRGILYRIIENSWGTLIAIILSALIFALLHLNNENTSVLSFLSVISGGLVFGILYTYTKNLLVPIAFHFGWNLTQILLGFGLSGGNEFSKLYIFKLNVEGKLILTGGQSGVENSILVIIILFTIFGVLYKKSQQENKLLTTKVKLSKKG